MPGFVNYLGVKYPSSYESIRFVINEIQGYIEDAYLRYKDPKNYLFETFIYEEAINALELFRDEYPHKEGTNFHELTFNEKWEENLGHKNKPEPKYKQIYDLLRNAQSEQGIVHSLKYMHENKKLKDNKKVQDVVSPSDLHLIAKSFKFDSKDLKEIRKGYFEYLENIANELLKKYERGEPLPEDMSEIAKALVDYADDRGFGLNDHDKMVDYLSNDLTYEALKKSLAAEVPSRIKFALNDPELNQFRYYSGVADLFFIEGDTLYIADFKPDVHFKTEGDLRNYAANVFPQLVAYGLMVQKKLRSTGSDLKIKFIAFNKEASIEFDPNLMYFQMFDFMTDYSYSEWHRIVTTKGEYAEGYKDYNKIEPNDELKKFFIDFYQIADPTVLKDQYGEVEYQRYYSNMWTIISQFVLDIKNIYCPS